MQWKLESLDISQEALGHASADSAPEELLHTHFLPSTMWREENSKYFQGKPNAVVSTDTNIYFNLFGVALFASFLLAAFRTGSAAESTK